MILVPSLKKCTFKYVLIYVNVLVPQQRFIYMHILENKTVRKLKLITKCKVKVGKCWPFVTEDGGSIDTLHYKLDVSCFKCED